MPFHLISFVPVPVVFQLFDLSKSWEDSYYDSNIENDNIEDGLRGTNEQDRPSWASKSFKEMLPIDSSFSMLWCRKKYECSKGS